MMFRCWRHFVENEDIFISFVFGGLSCFKLAVFLSYLNLHRPNILLLYFFIDVEVYKTEKHIENIQKSSCNCNAELMGSKSNTLSENILVFVSDYLKNCFQKRFLLIVLMKESQGALSCKTFSAFMSFHIS